MSNIFIEHKVNEWLYFVTKFDLIFFMKDIC
jgi:hypothetical protein